MEYDVYLLKENEKDILRFNLNKRYDIDLNSSDQTSIKDLFYKIIELSFEDEIVFKLNSEKHGQDLFYEVAVDYIEKLNAEVKQIRSETPSKLKETSNE